MKKLFRGLLMSLFMSVSTHAQTVEGDWQGTIKANDVELRLRLHVTKGSLSANERPFPIGVI
jgi:hypothetical protein